ncbi:MAG: hypothetical protein C4523_15760 [Myxococcales bacterium]|nr:MAG: hypothetical protein C4523_15760 [Myxococcales bacterium]
MFFKPDTAIHATYKGNEYLAKVTEDGQYELSGENFPSLYALSVKLQGKAHKYSSAASDCYISSTAPSLQ